MSIAEIETDLYPSRVADEPRIVPRRDPVIHSSPDEQARGPLSRAQLQRFEREGFLVLPEFFSPPEVSACLAELNRLRRSESVRRRPEAIVEPESDDLRSLFAVHAISPFFGDVACDERLIAMMHQILGSDAYIHQSRINLKPGFAGKEFYWHSDFETWHVEDGMPNMRAVSCSLLLTPNYEYNGPLLLIPGSHKHYVECVGETPENHYTKSLKRQEYGVPDHESLAWLAEQGGIQSATGPAGTLVLFECNTMHGSNSNISPFPRSNLFLVYNSARNRLQPPFCGLKPRPDYIAARGEVPPLTGRKVDYASTS